jgi:hypothetical protein
LNTTNLGATTPLPKVGSPFVFIERTSSGGFAWKFEEPGLPLLG